jgi:type IV pilus assembly protein PilW
VFGPVDIITNPAATISDASSHVLRIAYSETTEMGTNGVEFTQSAASNANYRVQNRSGFRTGDLVLAVEPGVQCTLAEITGLPASGQCGAGGGAGQTDVVVHNNGTYSSAARNCQNVAAAWNKPGGLGVSYTAAARLYNFGTGGFVATQFAVRNQRLMTCSTLSSTASDCAAAANWTPLVDQVVALQARYGVDTNDDGQIDTWTLALCDDSAGACTPSLVERLRVLAIRLAVVARSPQFERNQVTATAPQWLTDESLDAESVTFNLTHLANWQQYRYRVMETTIPLRNVIWAR